MMHRFSARTFSFAALFVFLATVSAQSFAQSPLPAFMPPAANDRYIVLLRDNTVPFTMSQEYGLNFIKTYTQMEKGFVSQLNAALVSELKHDPRVAVVEPDYIVTTQMPPVRSSFTFPNFPFPFPFPFPFGSSSSSSSSSVSSISSSSTSSSSSSQHSSSNVSSSSSSSVVSSSSSSVASSSQVVPTGVMRIHDLVSPTASIGNHVNVNADIAILDTGIDLTHPDLNVVHHINIITGCSEDSSGCGNDDNGHGTHVAGTAAAMDNNIGVVGVAPGARLWAVKVLNSQGSGYMSDIIDGINFIANHAGQIGVVNMSFGCNCQSSAFDSAINAAAAKGVVFVAAAGNSSQNAAGFSPANNPNVIAVSAMTDSDGKAGALGAPPSCRTSERDDTFASFSNYGSTVAIAAPGVCILSTWLNNGYNTISGTSMASPHVTGAVALYLATHGKPQNASDVAAVKQALIQAASPANSSDGFTGDPDGSDEPLLNVGSL